jgi:hypothetical protein
MNAWTFVRFLHLLGIIFLVGGQLAMLFAVTPVLRRGGNDAAMRAIARRFGIGSVVALGLLVVTGVAMASHFDDWGRSVLHVKLALIALVGGLIGLHVVRARTRGLSIALVVVSLVIVWLGLKLTYG